MTKQQVRDFWQGAVGQQHDGMSLKLAEKLRPRLLIKRLLPLYGLALLIRALK